jgi:hypothetical protein
MKIIYLLNKKKHFPPESVTNKENIKHTNSLEKENMQIKKTCAQQNQTQETCTQLML